MNVIIYSDEQQNNFEEMLISNDEAMVRSFPTAEITNYKDVNPSVMIFDMPLQLSRLQILGAQLGQIGGSLAPGVGVVDSIAILNIRFDFF